jgi:ABC-2 type transport system ATP-binding protein
LDSIPKIDGYPLKLLDNSTLVAAIDKSNSINDLFDEFTKLNIKVKSMRNEANRLEELFINMVKK